MGVLQQKKVAPLAVSPQVNSSSLGQNPTSKNDFGIVDLAKIVPLLKEYQDIEAAMRQEDEGKRRMLEGLSKEFQTLQQELASAGSTMKPSVRETKIERARDLQKTMEVKAQTYEEAHQRRGQEIQMRLFKQIEEVAEEIRKEMGLKAIFAGAVLCYDRSLDISEAVAQRMNTLYAAKKARQEKDTKNASNIGAAPK